MKGKRLALAVGIAFASLTLAACGAPPALQRPKPSPTTSPVIVSPSPSPSPSATPSATATSGSRVDLTFQGAVTGTMTVVDQHVCTAAAGTASLALEGRVAGRPYWLTIEISDPGLSAGSWSVSSPPSQRQGGLENSTPQVGLTATSPLYGAAPGASGTVTLTGDPATSPLLEGSLAATLVPVGSNSGTASLSLSGNFACQLS